MSYISDIVHVVKKLHVHLTQLHCNHCVL